MRASALRSSRLRRVASSSSSTHANRARRLSDVAKCQIDFFTRLAAFAVSFSRIAPSSRVFSSSLNANLPSRIAHSRSSRSTRQRSSASPARSSSNFLATPGSALSDAALSSPSPPIRLSVSDSSSAFPFRRVRSSLGTPRLGDADGEVFVSHRRLGAAGDGGTMTVGSTVRPSAASAATYLCMSASRRPSSFSSATRYSSRVAFSPGGGRRGLSTGAAGAGEAGGGDAAPDIPTAPSVRGVSGSVSSSSSAPPRVLPGVFAGYAERGGGVPGVDDGPAAFAMRGGVVAGVVGEPGGTGASLGTTACVESFAGVVSGVDAAAVSAAATAASAAANAAIAATSSSAPPRRRGGIGRGRAPRVARVALLCDAEEHQLQRRDDAAAGEEPPKVQRGAHARGEVEASRVPRVAAALRERRLHRVRSAGPYARQFTLRPRRGGYPRAVPEYPARGEQPVLKRSPRHRGDGGDEADAGEPTCDCARGGARGGGRHDPRGFLGAPRTRSARALILAAGSPRRAGFGFRGGFLRLER